MNDHHKSIQYLVSVEKLAEEILSDKRELILLDKRRQQNRETLRDIPKASQRKCWFSVGSVVVKNNIETVMDLLEADQKQINIDINKIRSDLKVKVNQLRDLEMQPPVPGLMLEPLSKKEVDVLSKTGLFSS